MATYLICHGAWSGGWSWTKMRAPLYAAGHRVFTPTYTGLGERAHLAHPMVDLDTHIQDVLAVVEYEDLSDFILVGHSYGGMVATGVADRIPEKVRHLVYLDAFVPADGQSLDDLTGQVRVGVESWLLAPNPPSPDTPTADLAWILPRWRRGWLGVSARSCCWCIRVRGFRAAISIARRRSDRMCSDSLRIGSGRMRAGGSGRSLPATART
jgi:pimeloyl-ACP methyl ester carboxylesterase